MPTLKEMLEYVTEPTIFLTDEANRELVNARYRLLSRAVAERTAFLEKLPNMPKEDANALFDQFSVWGIEMPPRPGYTGHERRWGMLYGMIIGEINDCIETSGRPATRRAAIDYLRREAAKRGVNFA